MNKLNLDVTQALDDRTLVEAAITSDDGQVLDLEELKQALKIDPGNNIAKLSNIATIGIGGIGAVFSAHEPVINRTIALKILRPKYRNQARCVADFIREARITAQIDHPNVVPVHQLGVFDDVGTYFTMKRVSGETLLSVLKKLENGDKDYKKKYTRYRLLEIFIAICNGVAFAHHKGIIHRDLKPGNIMLGDYGEVLVMDWGLAKYSAKDDHSNADEKVELEDELAPFISEAEEELHNKVCGTPAYMSPEQAQGLNDEVDAQSDLYSLGAILYSILTWKQTPFPGELTVPQIMRCVVEHRLIPPRRRAKRRHIPFELEAICLKAMACRKSDRYENVEALLADMRNYLDKFPVSAYSPNWFYRFYKLLRRRPLVPLLLAVIFLTHSLGTALVRWQNYVESQSLIALAEESLVQSRTYFNSAMGSHTRLQQYYTQSGNTNNLGTNLLSNNRYIINRDNFDNYCNTTFELLTRLVQLGNQQKNAESKLAELLKMQISLAIATDNWDQVKQTIRRLKQRSYGDLLQTLLRQDEELRQQLFTIEENIGELKVTANFVDVPVYAVFQNALRDSENAAMVNDLEEESESPDLLEEPPATEEKYLGKTPLQTALPAGVYLLKLDPKNGDSLQFPYIVRCGKFSHAQIDIPQDIPEETVYVPAGEFLFGFRTLEGHMASNYLNGFFIGKTEVSLGEYLEFWNSLTDDNQKMHYRAFRSSIQPGQAQEPLWDDAGNLVPPLRSNLPVTGITPEAVEAFCRYKSEKTNLHYRLPTALEWEKAARGVDGRDYVWGNEYQAQMALVEENINAVKRFSYGAPIETFQRDVSVYGALNMTGNVREFVTTQDQNLPYAVKGASFLFGERFAHAAAQTYTFLNAPDVGFRYVVELPAAYAVTPEPAGEQAE